MIFCNLQLKYYFGGGFGKKKKKKNVNCFMLGCKVICVLKYCKSE